MYRFFRFSTMASSVILDSSTMSSTPLCFTFWLCQWYLAWVAEKREEVGKVWNASFLRTWLTVSHFVEISFWVFFMYWPLLFWNSHLGKTNGIYCWRRYIWHQSSMLLLSSVSKVPVNVRLGPVDSKKAGCEWAEKQKRPDQSPLKHCHHSCPAHRIKKPFLWKWPKPKITCG